MRDKNNIFLIGFMGTGKSTVAGALAALTRMEVVDTDKEIALREGRTVSAVFRESGEAYFRDAETALLESCGAFSGCIIACGGGMPLREENRRLMKAAGKAVLLTAAPETVLARLREDTGRPLLSGKKEAASIRALMEERRSAYEAAADIVVDTNEKTPAAIAREILKKLEGKTGEKCC